MYAYVTGRTLVVVFHNDILAWKSLLQSWGQSAAYAVVTSISNPCGDFNGGGD